MKNVKKYKKFWANEFFDDEDILSHFESRQLPAIEDFHRYFTVKTFYGLKIFEQCCGNGDILNIFEKQGAKVFGVDISEKSIYYGKKKYPKLENNLFFGDARDCYFLDCDIVLNYYSSFGYFPKDEENVRIIEKAYKSLKNNGIFLLETLDLEYIKNNFKKEFKDRDFIRKSKLTNK